MKKIKSINNYAPNYLNSFEFKIPIFSKILNINIQNFSIGLIYEFDIDNENIIKSVFIDIIKGNIFEYSKLEYRYFSTIIEHNPKIVIVGGGDSASFKIVDNIEQYNIFVNDMTIQEKRNNTIEFLNV